ncbi:hypothetical protein K493DRAFT_332485 [Basidiobolus meristosporus CBS 931.73]|uniref:Uncharacterized protein n=1 Tax=Basidiobolus meristosporus CBS 931.73 TaxID=1314790 RepID=A0A1Y1ZEA0_9FUNG|nr:hypothetical protein K493DRAFT_332485 [Basidiobolus meristosporus CBS 931.73]|eukprot:ORY08155.1 hypothetical protein K493DRAFT_332485 [Basidiobolus meristosporus CBS 931.73]
MEATTTLAIESINLGDNRNIRDSFIALFIFWIIWALLLLADQGSESTSNNQASATGSSLTKHFRGLHCSVSHTQKVARNVFITMLWMLVASTLGLGLTHGSMILTWIYFSFAVVWVFVDLVLANGLIHFEHTGLIDATFGLIEFGLALTVMSIGYSRGW